MLSLVSSCVIGSDPSSFCFLKGAPGVTEARHCHLPRQPRLPPSLVKAPEPKQLSLRISGDIGPNMTWTDYSSILGEQRTYSWQEQL